MNSTWIIPMENKKMNIDAQILRVNLAHASLHNEKHG
jgi:hypothetical protein